MRIDLADLRKQKEIKQAQETLKNKENSLYELFVQVNLQRIQK